MSHGSGQRIRALEAATIVGIAVIFCRPAAAQTSEGDGACMDVGPHYSDAASLREQLLPDNLAVPEVLKPLLTRMWRSSATFRRQCAQLADRPDVIIRISLDPRTTHGRAVSRVNRSDAVRASISFRSRVGSRDSSPSRRRPRATGIPRSHMMVAAWPTSRATTAATVAVTS
jgi:hypothetical protein